MQAHSVKQSNESLLGAQHGLLTRHKLHKEQAFVVCKAQQKRDAMSSTLVSSQEVCYLSRQQEACQGCGSDYRRLRGGPNKHTGKGTAAHALASRDGDRWRLTIDAGPKELHYVRVVCAPEGAYLLRRDAQQQGGNQQGLHASPYSLF